MTLTIARVSTETLDAFVESVAGLFAEDAGVHDPTMDTTWPEREGRDYYRGILDDEKSLCLLATTDGRPAGHLVGHLPGPRSLHPGEVIAELVSMRVADHARRTGVGSALIDEFRKWAAENGVTQANVTAFANNSRAISFYQSNGFVPHELTLWLRSGLGG